MRDGWIIKRLDEVCMKFGAGPFGSNMKVSTFVDTGIPVVSGNHMTELELLEKSFNYITEEHANKMQSSIVQRNDVVITKAGTIGQVSLIPENSRFLKYVLSSRQLFVRPNLEQVLPKYLAIYLKYGRGQDQILSNVNRTGVPSLSQAVSFIKNVRIELPPLPEQKRIVDLISSVDDYIKALQQQLESAKKSRNAVLHELLTAGGDDWVETTLGEVALLNPSEPALSDTAHFAPMDAVHVGKRWLQYTEERRDRNGARARAGDVLFARITPCLENGKVAQVQSELERCGGSTEFIVVRGTEKCTSDFLYFWCTLKVNRDKAAELMTGTTGRQRLSWQGLGGLGLWLPSIAEQERIVNNISEFDSLIESTESAISESQNLRSGLLSDLLSGEHEIPASYDKVIGAAR